MKDKQKRKKERTWAEAARMVNAAFLAELPLDVAELMSAVFSCVVVFGYSPHDHSRVCSNLSQALK